MSSAMLRALAAVAGVVKDGRGVAALAGLDHFDAAAAGPDFKLLDGGGAEGVGGAEQDGLVLGAIPGGELAAGGGFAGAVDADEEGDFGRGGGVATGRIGASRIPRICGLEQVAQFFAAVDCLEAGAFAEGVDDLGGGLHADVAHDERGFEFFEGGLVDLAGEGDDVVDLGGEGLAGARDGLLHAVEEAGFLLFFLLLLWFFGFFEAAKQADEIGHGLYSV